MQKELLIVETYNDSINTVRVAFDKLHADYSNPENPYISVICREIHEGPAGNFTVPFSMYNSNEFRVPVFRYEGESLVPVMEETTPGLSPEDESYQPPRQQTIGEFDLWRKLLFEGNAMPINAAIEKGIMIKKGLTTEPFIYIMPTED